MAEKELPTESHSFFNEGIFRLKASGLIGIRFLRNLFLSRPERFRTGKELKHEQVISSSETVLWSTDDNEDNWILTAGKVHNLRIAVRKLHGLEIPANSTFSFWRHIGMPSKLRGYEMGREIREGCIVPTIAGGLCQLSNALYDAALKAGFQVLERHRHTRVIKGSLAEQNRDATVKWNYLDLRFKSANRFRIEAELTAEHLIVKFKSTSERDVPAPVDGADHINIPASKLNDCYSCGNFDCFKHPALNGSKKKSLVTTYLLDEKWSEYERYMHMTAKENDRFITAMPSNGPLTINRYRWSLPKSRSVSVWRIALLRSLVIRATAKTKWNIFALTLYLDKLIAMRMIPHIPIESTHLVISQNLLPSLWREGALGGRTFDVLMTRLPMEKLHQRLDTAHSRHRESLTLGDFRASADLVECESIALTKARHVITPHQEIADIFIHKSVKLDWTLPKPGSRYVSKGGKVLFPASSLGRKGAYEVRQLAREQELALVVLGSASEDPAFWNGVNVVKTNGDPFDDVALVVYPAYVEHQPRILLKAIASGIPVIATTACGLSEGKNVTLVPVGDYEVLKRAVSDALNDNMVPLLDLYASS